MLVNALRHFLTHDIDVIVNFVVCVMFVVVALLQPYWCHTCYLSIVVRQVSQKCVHLRQNRLKFHCVYAKNYAGLKKYTAAGGGGSV